MMRGSKEGELGVTADLYHRAAYSMARAGCLNEAVVTLERGRARGLSEALARDRADLEEVKALNLATFKQYQQAAARMRQLENGQLETGSESVGGNLPPTTEDLRTQTHQARADLDYAIEQIRRIPGFEDFLAEPNWDDVEGALIDGTPIVYLNTTAAGSLIIILRRSGSEIDADPMFLGFTIEDLHEILIDWFKAYEIFTLKEVHRPWFEAVEKVTHRLWKDLMGPVVFHLQDVLAEQALLIPTGLLALLPLHAAWTEEMDKRQYALDRVTFSYVPSARSLTYARRIAETTPAEYLFAIEEPKPVTKGKPLHYTHLEVAAIEALYESPQILHHEYATRRAALDGLLRAQVAHFSCHGKANLGDPDRSGLLMANDETLTVEDLYKLNLMGARLATLSACETGLIGAKLPDEVVALPSAFMRAGFAGVVASLWAVDDRSTAMLMERFYTLWRKKGIKPALALKNAQHSVRDNYKEHPYWWAAFYMTGV